MQSFRFDVIKQAISAMKIFLSILLVFVLCGSVVRAQDSSPMWIYSPAMESVWFGGIGVGIAAHDNSSFSDRLQSWSPVGESGREMVYRTGRFSGTGYTLNAGGGMLFGKNLLVGASGELLLFPAVNAVTSDDRQSDYNLSGGGGQLELGWVAYNYDATLVWPYIALGYYGYSLDFKNNQSDSIPFFEGEPVPSGETATYTGASFRPGLGVGLTRFLGGKKGSKRSGLVLTAKLGWGLFVSHPEWENESGGIVNNGGKTPCYSGVGLSITIGGGSGMHRIVGP